MQQKQDRYKILRNPRHQKLSEKEQRGIKDPQERADSKMTYATSNLEPASEIIPHPKEKIDRQYVRENRCDDDESERGEGETGGEKGRGGG